jgi:hypothetical protein
MLTRFTNFAPLGAVAVAAFIAAAPQSASALEFRFNGPAAASFKGVSWTRFNPPTGVSTTDIESTPGALAGAFDFDEVDGGGTVLSSFVAWCFDLDNGISTGTYTYNAASGLLSSNPPYLAGAQTRVQTLFDSAYDLDETDGVLSSAVNSAAFQLALWEVLYDDDLDLGTTLADADTNGGYGFAGSGGDGVTAKAQYYLGKYDPDAAKAWNIATFDSESAQDIGVATAIPLPAAAWLLLGVSGALVGAKRRSARKAA